MINTGKSKTQRPNCNALHSSSYRYLAVGGKWRHLNIKFWDKQPTEKSKKSIGWGADWYTGM